ncbi:MAG: lipoyl domain-containing protein [bacterium]|nr:lipoyl domain-containing protein [bacterium]
MGTSEHTYRLEELAADLDRCEVAAWHVGTGSVIGEGDDLLDVVTDKACITIPAPVAGRVVRQHVGVGTVVLAGDAVVTLAHE